MTENRKKLIEDATTALSVAVTERAKLNVIIRLLLAVVEAPPKPVTFTEVPSDGDDRPPYGAGVWPGIGR